MNQVSPSYELKEMSSVPAASCMRPASSHTELKETRQCEEAVGSDQSVCVLSWVEWIENKNSYCAKELVIGQSSS
jgi:hypothetical protein